MEVLKKKCIEIIDACFDEVVFEQTGNKLKDQILKAELLSGILEKVTNLCVSCINELNPEKAKEFTNSGFIKQYIMQKQKDFLVR